MALPSPTAAPGDAAPGEAGAALSRDELTKAWGDTVLPALPGRVKAYLALGRFVATDGDVGVYALPDPGLLGRAGIVTAEAEAALSAHLRRPVRLRLVLDPVGVEGGRRSSPITAAPPGSAFRPSDAVGRSNPSGGPPATEPDREDPADYSLEDLQDAEVGVRSPEQRLLEAFPGAEEVDP